MKMKQLPAVSTLRGEGFELAPFRVEDISDAYLAMLNNPQVNRFLEVRWTPQTFETAAEFVKSFYQDDEKYIWGIYAAGTREFAGTATLYLINRIHGSAELGLMIGEAFWGKGASRTALTLIIDHAFNALKLRRLTGESYVTNHGMNFTFKQLNFRLEGRMVQACALDRSGAYVDTFRWAILKDEWRPRAAPRL
jgi:ribosomal-protein-alanine N-acetyltransferase